MDKMTARDLLVLDEACLPEVLLALLLLLGVVVGDVGGVAPLVVAVVTLDHVIVLKLLHHLDLVNTSLAVRTRGGGRHSWEADIRLTALLPLCSVPHTGRPHIPLSSVTMMSSSPMMVMVMSISTGVKWECVQQRLGFSVACVIVFSVSPQMTSAIQPWQR